MWGQHSKDGKHDSLGRPINVRRDAVPDDYILGRSIDGYDLGLTARDAAALAKQGDIHTDPDGLRWQENVDGCRIKVLHRRRVPVPPNVRRDANQDGDFEILEVRAYKGCG